jgi:hypothetical protein
MRRILTFDFMQNNNNARSGFTSAKKRSGLVSNVLKWWRNDFVTVKRQRDGLGAFRKETGCHPAPPQALLTARAVLYVLSYVITIESSWVISSVSMEFQSFSETLCLQHYG